MSKKRSAVLAAILFVAANAAKAEIIHIPGKVNGFPQLRRDDTVDGAIVIQSLRPMDVIQFQIDQLMSPSEDMNAGPLKAKVPGNLYFPRQTELYGIIPVVFKKEAFTFTTPRELNQEVTTIYFQTPFAKMIELSQNHAPATEMMKYISFKAFGFEGDRNYANTSSITTTLNKNFHKDINFQWTRSSAPEGSSDVIANFQETPTGRWMFSDMVANPAASGKIASAEGLARSFKTLFVRTTNDSEGKIKSAVGQIRHGTNQEAYNVNGLPDSLSGAALQNQNHVVWDAFCQAGWMAVMHTINTTAQSPSPFSRFLSLNLEGLRPLTMTQKWVNPGDGQFTFDSAIAQNDNLSLIFVGTDREVPAPQDGQDSSDLFTYATELRMLQIQ